MHTLHIEHPIADFTMWKAAFDRLADKRKNAGVRQHRVQRPVDDPAYVLIDLDFGSSDEAEAFLEFLKSRVWSSREASPALTGAPQTKILDLVDVH
jgi:hypothetical protein